MAAIAKQKKRDSWFRGLHRNASSFWFFLLHFERLLIFKLFNESIKHVVFWTRPSFPKLFLVKNKRLETLLTVLLVKLFQHGIGLENAASLFVAHQLFDAGLVFVRFRLSSFLALVFGAIVSPSSSMGQALLDHANVVIDAIATFLVLDHAQTIDVATQTRSFPLQLIAMFSAKGSPFDTISFALLQYSLFCVVAHQHVATVRLVLVLREHDARRRRRRQQAVVHDDRPSFPMLHRQLLAASRKEFFSICFSSIIVNKKKTKNTDSTFFLKPNFSPKSDRKLKF